jgi:hypothetical protein
MIDYDISCPPPHPAEILVMIILSLPTQRTGKQQRGPKSNTIHVYTFNLPMIRASDARCMRASTQMSCECNALIKFAQEVRHIARKSYVNGACTSRGMSAHHRMLFWPPLYMNNYWSHLLGQLVNWSISIICTSNQ